MTIVPRAAPAMLQLVWKFRSVLRAITRVELQKRYAGSVLGLGWLLLYPMLLLGIYLFVYVVIFKVHFTGLTVFGYALFVFVGLVPFLGCMEAITTGTVSLKQNMHLVRNVLLPIDLVPVRTVLVGIATEVVALGIVVLLTALEGSLSPWIILLPVTLTLQILFMVGLVLVLSSLAVVLPDVSYFVNLSMLLLGFVSPIGFRPDMVPASFAPIVYLNPLHYMIDAFRMTILADHPLRGTSALVYVTVCVAMFVAGAAFFRRFKQVLVDYE